MSLINEKRGRGKLVAVYDGAGDSRTVGLYVEFENGDSEELPFPPHYPQWLSPDFLRSEGFEIIEA